MNMDAAGTHILMSFLLKRWNKPSGHCSVRSKSLLKYNLKEKKQWKGKLLPYRKDVSCFNPGFMDVIFSMEFIWFVYVCVCEWVSVFSVNPCFLQSKYMYPYEPMMDCWPVNQSLTNHNHMCCFAAKTILNNIDSIGDVTNGKRSNGSILMYFSRLTSVVSFWLIQCSVWIYFIS